MTGRAIIMPEIITATPTLTSDSMATVTAGIITIMVAMTMVMGTITITVPWHRMVATMVRTMALAPLAAFIPMLPVDFMAPQPPWVESTSVGADSVEEGSTAADLAAVDSTAAEAGSTAAAVAGTAKKS